jgi:hypothetical protein
MTKRNLLLVGLLLVFGLGVMAPVALAQAPSEGLPTIVNVASAVFTLRPNSIGDADGAVFINFSSSSSGGTIAGGEVFTVTYSQPIVGAAGIAGLPQATAAKDFCDDSHATGLAVAGTTTGLFCGAMTYSSSASGTQLILTNGTAAITGWSGGYITIWGTRVNTSTLLPGTPITAYVIAAFNQSYPIEFSTTGATQSGLVNVGLVANTVGSVTATPTASSILTCIGPTEGESTTFSIAIREQWAGAWTSLTDEQDLAPYAPTANDKVSNGSEIAIVLTNIPNGVTITPEAPGTFTGTPVFAAPPAAYTSTAAGSTTTFIYTLTSTVRSEIEAATFTFEFTIPGVGISVNNPPMVASVELYPPPNATTVVYPAFVYPLNATALEEPTSPFTVITFVGCQTSLLWPYVTDYYGGGTVAQNNWDTAFAVANTTSDPFGPPNFSSAFWPGGYTPEVGACNFYVYDAGTAAPGVPATSLTPVTATPLTFSSPVVLSGGVYGNMLSLAVGNNAVAHGYMIGTCNFLGAVGYGALVDNANVGGNWDAYSNYIAYVIPNPNVFGRTFDGVAGEFAIVSPWCFDGSCGDPPSSSSIKALRQSLGLRR